MAEIFSNLDSLLTRARAHSPALPAYSCGSTLIKAYLRNRDDLTCIERELRERLPEPLAAGDLRERPCGVLEYLGTLRRDARKRPAFAHEQVEPEFPLQRLERPADRRLRGAQRRGRLRDRQPVMGNGHRVLELMKVHGTNPGPQRSANYNNVLSVDSLFFIA